MDTAEPSLSAPRTSAWRRVAESVDRVAWTESTRVVLASRIVFLAVAYAATWFLANTQGRSTVGFLQMWNQWDVQHFLRIADKGYFAYPDFPNEIAFFPLFPMLIKGLAAIGFNPVLGGMIISFVSSLVAGNYLFKLAEHDAPGSGRRALLYLFLFPTAVFLVAPYSEALFLAGAIAAFYYARRERWVLVGLPAAVAVGSRAAGIFLLIGLAVEFLRQRKFGLDRISQAAIAFAVGLLPLLLYGFYLTTETGSPWSFMEAQRRGWYREFTSPIKAFTATWETWNGSYATNWIFAWRVEILGAIVGVVFVAWALRKREWGYAAFMGTTLASLMTSSWYFSIPRILLTFFPALLFLAAWTGKRDGRHEIALMVLMPLAALGVVVFTRGIWFF
ncbi:MAG TPA: mannosyltransferase family protein [Actinomycetota bacterium]|nr:mannosyltransferase family protein [Actinomycetota bacterium]